MADLDCTVAEFCNPHSTWGRITAWHIWLHVVYSTYNNRSLYICKSRHAHWTMYTILSFFANYKFQLESIKKKTGISEIPTRGLIQIRYHVLKTLQENSIDIRRMRMIRL